MRWLPRPQAPEPRVSSSVVVNVYGNTEQELEDNARKQAREFFPPGTDFALKIGWHAAMSGDLSKGRYFAGITAVRYL
jgi:hypothetical protein